MARPLPPGPRGSRVASPVVLVGGLVSIVMALLMTGSVTASAGPDKPLLDSVGALSETTPEVTVSQSTGTTICDTSTCSNANLFGGTSAPLLPGVTRSITMRFTNDGRQSIGTRRLVAGNCVSSTTPGVVGSTAPAGTNTLCDTLRLQVYEGAPSAENRLFDGAPGEMPTTIRLGALAPHAMRVYTFEVTLPAAATSSSQGQTVTQPLTWTNNV